MSNDWISELDDFRAVQKAVVRGSAKACDGENYPTIFNRLDNSETLSWINEIVFSIGKSNDRTLGASIIWREKCHLMSGLLKGVFARYQV